MCYVCNSVAMPVNEPPGNCHLNVKISPNLPFIYFNCQKLSLKNYHWHLKKKRQFLAFYFFKWQVLGQLFDIQMAIFRMVRCQSTPMLGPDNTTMAKMNKIRLYIVER